MTGLSQASMSKATVLRRMVTIRSGSGETYVLTHIATASLPAQLDGSFPPFDFASWWAYVPAMVRTF